MVKVLTCIFEMFVALECYAGVFDEKAMTHIDLRVYFSSLYIFIVKNGL